MSSNSHASHANGIGCTFLNEKVLHEGTWLRFHSARYIDPKGKERLWEYVRRTTRMKESDSDAVTTIAIYRRMFHYDVIVLIRQYRPALRAFTIEFPTGLLEHGETDAEPAALRVLEKETGWVGQVTHVSPSFAVDPGCSSAVVRYVTVKINGDAYENTTFKPRPGDSEFIELLMIPFTDVHEHLERLTKEGNTIDSRVACWAIGLRMGLKVAEDACLDAASANSSSLPADGNSLRTGLLM